MPASIFCARPVTDDGVDDVELAGVDALPVVLLVGELPVPLTVELEQAAMQPAAARALTATTRRLTMTPIEAQRCDGHGSGRARLSTGGAAKSPSHARIEGMRYRVLAPVALIVVFVAGCTTGSGGGDPTRTPSVTSPVTTPTTPVESSSTPTHSTPPTKVPTTGPNVRPGEKPPKLDALGHQRSAPGVVEFATFWVRAIDWGYATTNPNILRGLFLPSCVVCENFLKNFSFTAAHHQHFEGGRVSILQAVLARSDTKNGARAVDVTMKAAPLRIVTDAGVTVRRSRGERVTLRIWARWIRGNWRVAREAQVVSR